MIVRIMGEGQFRLADDQVKRVNELDNAAVAAVESDDEDGFHEAFEQMIQIIRSDGQPIADEELEASDVIVPPADTTFVEAATDFTGEGLIPDPT
jgi:hypothetical protein